MISELSEEAALVKGAEILDARRELQQKEAELKKRMRHSMMKEWMFWLGVALCFLNSYVGTESIVSPRGLLNWLPAVLFILSGMECAAMKREQALIDWIGHQKSKDKPQS